MEQIVTYDKQLPDNIEDIARFAIFNSEKLKSLKAEINAIDKLHLAKEVYDQKIKEQQILGELVMDAFIKLGQFSKQLPKAKGNQHTEKLLCISGDTKQKTKEEVMADLGFSRCQTQRLEILANNPDVVEQVKQEARENDDIPTRTRVIDIVQQRKKEQSEKVIKSSKDYRQFHNALYGILTLDTTSVCDIAEWITDCRGISVEEYISDIGRTIEKLDSLRAAFINYERSL
ncbi:MAG: hypothetical protein ACI4GX_08055 [Ruminococcus sp.]